MLGIVVAMTLLGSLVFAAPSSNSTICFVIVAAILFVGRHLDQVALTLPEPVRSIVYSHLFCHPASGISFDVRDLIIHDWPLIGWKYCRPRPALCAGLHGGFSRRRLPGFPPQSRKLKHEFAAHIFSAAARAAGFLFRPRRAFCSRSFKPGAGSRASPAIFSTSLLGDSRRMFANSFYVKADEYYHSGYYPTIFDNNAAFQNAAHGRGHRRGQQQKSRRRRRFSRPAARLD